MTRFLNGISAAQLAEWEALMIVRDDETKQRELVRRARASRSSVAAGVRRGGR